MLLALGGTLPIMLGEWLFQLGSVGWFRWLSFFLAAVVQAIAGARFYRGAWTQLKTGSSNMDTLVALGSTTASLQQLGLIHRFSCSSFLHGRRGHYCFG